MRHVHNVLRSLRSGIKRRRPQEPSRSEVSHNTMSTSRALLHCCRNEGTYSYCPMASSHDSPEPDRMLTMSAGHCHEIITDAALIAAASNRYRTTIAATSSDRVAMLIRLVIQLRTGTARHAHPSRNIETVGTILFEAMLPLTKRRPPRVKRRGSVCPDNSPQRGRWLQSTKFKGGPFQVI